MKLIPFSSKLWGLIDKIGLNYNHIKQVLTDRIMKSLSKWNDIFLLKVTSLFFNIMLHISLNILFPYSFGSWKKYLISSSFSQYLQLWHQIWNLNLSTPLIILGTMRSFIVLNGDCATSVNFRLLSLLAIKKMWCNLAMYCHGAQNSFWYCLNDQIVMDCFHSFSWGANFLYMIVKHIAQGLWSTAQFYFLNLLLLFYYLWIFLHPH